MLYTLALFIYSIFNKSKLSKTNKYKPHKTMKTENRLNQNKTWLHFEI